MRQGSWLPGVKAPRMSLFPGSVFTTEMFYLFLEDKFMHHG
jgi:hypothetical protein